MAARQNITPISPVDSSKLDQDTKRASDRRHKYNLGSFDNGSRVQPTTVRRMKAPMIFDLRAARIHPQKRAASKMLGKHPLRSTDDDVMTSDSSAPEDEFGAPSVVPEPDADIAYSYDAPAGPSRGNDVLSVAINRAVERFETKVTEKLVRDEYDVIEQDKHADNHAAGYAADEDDFELV